jgi:O-glycosyl hydrolase
MRGLGAASVWIGSKITAALADTFWLNDNVNGHVGFSLLRTRIVPTGDGTDSGEMSPMTLALARNPNIMIWSTAWTPPAAYKDNNNTTAGNFNATTANQTAYANFLVNYVKSVKSQKGVTLYAVSPQNEPDLATSYDSCVWTAAQFQVFIRDYMGPAFKTAGLTTKILMPEHSKDNLSMSASTMGDSAAAAYVSIIGGHLYGGGPNILPASYGSVDNWETEYSDYSNLDTSMTSGLSYAMSIHKCFVTANMNAYHFWWLINNNTDNEGLCDSSGNPCKRLYTMGNYSKFIRPGFVRIGATASPATNINSSAYMDPGTGKFVVIAINQNTSTSSQSFTFNGITATTVTPWLTDVNNNLVAQTAVAVTNGSFTYTLPAQSVLSFVGTSGSVAATSTNTSTVTAPTATKTNTLIAPTATNTNTAIVATTTKTNTVIAPSFTSTYTLTQQATQTFTSTPTAGATAVTGGRIGWMNGCTIWPVGDNYAWLNWGTDFSNTNWASNFTTIKSDLDTMYSRGVRVVRWWVFTDFQSSPLWSGTDRGSTCTGLPANWTVNMKAVCDYAATKGMKFYFCLSSFDMAKTAHAWHHDDVISDATVRTSFINNAVIPVVSALAANAGVFGWDIVNEPEWMIQASDNGGADTTCTQFSLAQVRAYAQAMATAIHANASQPVSVGSASLKWCSKKGGYSYDYWSGIGLDFYDAHFYDWMTASGYDPVQTTAASWKLDKPVMVGEALSDPSTYSGTLNPKNYQTFAEALYKNGYAGLLAWAWTDTANNCQNTINPYLNNFLAAHADVGSIQCSVTTNTPTYTYTYTKTNTPVPSNTNTFTSTSTSTNTAVPFTSTSTNTAVPPTFTATNTTVPPTFTATNTTVPPTFTATNTTVPPTFTSTNTTMPPTFTATNTTVPPTFTATNTTVPPTFTATNTTVPPTFTSTNTTMPPTFTATNTTVPPTFTSTNTTMPPTFTVTNIVVPPTSTNTAIVATMIPTSTNTAIPTAVPPTSTNTAIAATMIPTSTKTAIPTTVPPTSTNTVVPPTVQPTFTNTAFVPTLTATNTKISSTATMTFTAVPAATFTATSGSSSASVEIKFRAGDTNNSTTSPHPNIELINTGSQALNLNNIEVRYWYNCDCTGQAEQAYLDWAGKMPLGQTVTQDMTISVISANKADQTNYVSVKFLGNSNIIIQPNEYIEFHERFNKSDWSAMLQANDWSFTQGTSFVIWNRITVYQNGNLIYGQEPAATQAQLKVSAVMSYPNPANSKTGATLSYNISNPGVSASSTGRTAYITDPDAIVVLNIYTSSDRLIWQKELHGVANTSSGGHICFWDGKASGGQKLSSGTYTFRVELKSNGGSSKGYSRIIMFR